MDDVGSGARVVGLRRGLERKGRVRKLAVGGLCSSSGCSKCGLTPPELYEPIER